MRKPIFIVLLFLVLFAPLRHAAAGDITLKQSQPGEWQMLDDKGVQLGTLRGIEEGAYTVQLPSGDYLGVILKTGELKKPGRHPAITPAEAQFYLDIWKAIKKIQ